MQIQVVYMGGSRAQAGCAREPLEVPEGATVAEAVRCIVLRHPALQAWLGQVRWARNFEFVEPETVLAPQDELALLPPVAGGAPRAWLSAEPLSVDQVLERVQGAHVGATVIFVGTVRNRNRGQAVQRLTYEAYAPMAARQLDHIAEAASVNDTEVAIAHRHGDLAVGEISVVIAAAAPHRDAAFSACREALERVKADVAIYKLEQSPEGESWIGWGGG